jgi:undecaprenyl-diphosphatase
LVQGITEFLPISSSGHLVILQSLLGVKLPGITFEIMLHVGTLGAVLFAFGQRAWSVVRGTLAVILSPRKARGPDRVAARLGLALVVGSIPAAVAGLALRPWFERLFELPGYAGAGLILTGFLLMLARERGRRGRGLQEVPLGTALVVGCFQALAIAPGISRAGATITAGLWMGLERRSAAEFSFLLSLPAVAGAMLLDLPDLLAAPAGEAGLGMVLGAAAAAVAGYFAIRALLRFLRAGRYHLFAYYVWALGLAVLWWQWRLGW